MRVMGIQNICDSVGTHTEALVIIHLVGGIRSKKVCVFCFCSVLFLLTLTLYYFKLYNIMICCLYIYNYIYIVILYILGFPCGSASKESACNAGDLGLEDPLEKGKATHSTVLAWRIPCTV